MKNERLKLVIDMLENGPQLTGDLVKPMDCSYEAGQAFLAYLKKLGYIDILGQVKNATGHKTRSWVLVNKNPPKPHREPYKGIRKLDKLGASGLPPVPVTGRQGPFQYLIEAAR